MAHDIIHFFDDKGHSWISREHLAAENERLARRVAELERIVLLQQQRWRQFDPSETQDRPPRKQ